MFLNLILPDSFKTRIGISENLYYHLFIYIVVLDALCFLLFSPAKINFNVCKEMTFSCQTFMIIKSTRIEFKKD